MDAQAPIIFFFVLKFCNCTLGPTTMRGCELMLEPLTPFDISKLDLVVDFSTTPANPHKLQAAMPSVSVRQHSHSFEFGVLTSDLIKNSVVRSDGRTDNHTVTISRRDVARGRCVCCGPTTTTTPFYDVNSLAAAPHLNCPPATNYQLVTALTSELT